MGQHASRSHSALRARAVGEAAHASARPRAHTLHPSLAPARAGPVPLCLPPSRVLCRLQCVRKLMLSHNELTCEALAPVAECAGLEMLRCASNKLEARRRSQLSRSPLSDRGWARARLADRVQGGHAARAGRLARSSSCSCSC